MTSPFKTFSISCLFIISLSSLIPAGAQIQTNMLAAPLPSLSMSSLADDINELEFQLEGMQQR